MTNTAVCSASTTRADPAPEFAGTTDVAHLVRPAVSNKSDGPVVLFWVGKQTSHGPRADTAGLGFGDQPAIAHARDNFCGAREQSAYFHIIAGVLRW